MAKAIKFFSGMNSKGDEVQRAQSDSGVWFTRYFEHNGFGLAWSAWAKYKGDNPTECGFKTLTESSPSGYKLPETVKLGFYSYHNNLVFVRNSDMPHFDIVVEHDDEEVAGPSYYTKGEKLPKSMEFLAANYDSDEVQEFMRSKRK